LRKVEERDAISIAVDFERLNGGETRYTLATVDIESGDPVIFDTGKGQRIEWTISWQAEASCRSSRRWRLTDGCWGTAGWRSTRLLSRCSTRWRRPAGHACFGEIVLDRHVGWFGALENARDVSR